MSSEGKAIRKAIQHAAPGRLEEVCKHIRTLTTPTSADGVTPAWVEEDLKTYCLEYIIVNQVPIAVPGEEGAYFTASKYNHLHTLLTEAGVMHPEGLAQELAPQLGGLNSTTAEEGDEEAALSAFISELFIRFSDSGPQLVRVQTTTARATNLIPAPQDQLSILSDLLKEEREAERYTLVEAAYNILWATLTEDANNAVDVIPIASKGSESKEYILAFSSERLNAKAGWSGRWSSSYKLSGNLSDFTTEVSEGTIRCHVHSNEDGNIQMNSSSSVEVDLQGKSFLSVDGDGQTVDDSGARGVMRAVRRAEAAFSEGLEGTMVGVSDSPEFKSLRRKLPVNKQLFDFEAAVNSAAARATSALANEKESHPQ